MILNTQQIILLCLLVSFVTSIATGITTVSLLQQAPEPVTQTINRVIERTVESVASNEPIEQIKSIITNSPAPEKEVVTVVVNQEDQTINAIAKNQNSIVRISNERTGEFVTLGVILDANGTIAVDKRSINKYISYVGRIGDKSYPLKFRANSDTKDLTIMEISGENPGGFTAASFGDSSTLKLAQSVISLSGTRDTSVSTGEVTSLPAGSIKTSVDGSLVLNGSVLLNLQGLIVGFKLSGSEDRMTFMPSNDFKSQISAP